MLFVSDKDIRHNLYSYNFENGTISKLTDARIGVLNPKWLSKDIIAFNSFNKGGMEVYAMPLPKLLRRIRQLAKKKSGASKETECESLLDKLYWEKVANWEDYEIIKKSSPTTKIAIAIVNRNISLRARSKSDLLSDFRRRSGKAKYPAIFHK